MTQRSLVQIQPPQPERRGKVIATTRNRERVKKHEDLGAHPVELEGSDLSKRIAEAKRIDAVLDLVGNRPILDSLWMLRRGGRACLAGGLGGLELAAVPVSVYAAVFVLVNFAYCAFVWE